jgi:uncharacterized protein
MVNVGQELRQWPATLELDSLRAHGWQPTPFRQFILKLHGRCNLACDYCYVYELADQTWRTKPPVMSGAVLAAVAGRIAEHLRGHDVGSARVIFHGGEPLLTGPAPIAAALRAIRHAVGPDVQIEGRVQTNGTLLTADVLDQLEPLGIRIGVSLDGDALTHDRSRRYASGRGSYEAVARGLGLLMRRPASYSGLLGVIDLRADPVGCYEAMLAFAPPLIDFHFPHGNWSAPPPGRPDLGSAPYASWLISVFDRWYDRPARETRIRLFEEIIHLLGGGQSESEVVGLTPSSLVVIDTDGGIEISDALKSAYDGAAATGLNVTAHSFDAALRLPQVAAGQLGALALSDQCLACPVQRICGGGLYAHRYKSGAGFRQPSVYCADLAALIAHISGRVRADLSRLATG